MAAYPVIAQDSSHVSCRFLSIGCATFVGGRDGIAFPIELAPEPIRSSRCQSRPDERGLEHRSRDHCISSLLACHAQRVASPDGGATTRRMGAAPRIMVRNGQPSPATHPPESVAAQVRGYPLLMRVAHRVREDERRRTRCRLRRLRFRSVGNRIIDHLASSPPLTSDRHRPDGIGLSKCGFRLPWPRPVAASGATVSKQPIADYALVSDCHSSALIDRGGSVDWWCTPRFDSPSVLGRILDERAGHFSIRPSGDATVDRAYVDGTLVLTTTFHTAEGTVELTDALAMADGVRAHDLGKDSPHVFLRRATCTSGSVELEVEFSPRPEYGLTTPLLRITPDGATARGGTTRLDVFTNAPLDRSPGSASVESRVRLAAGDSIWFAVQSSPSWDPEPAPLNPEEIERRIGDTIAAWRSWEAVHQSYQGAYADLVRSSGRVLQGLTYHPTGAIVAAPTTSLPEVVGGERNWDYRYAWVRDASFTLNALWVAACPHEADRFLQYLTTAASSIAARGEIQIMFGIRGERDLTERELPHLGGWRSSRPVRVGNGAWNQRQLDVYGELLSAVHQLQDVMGDFDNDTSQFLMSLADTAAAVWRETDQGIWEVRGEPRHYLYSKLMCWVALDRAIDMASKIGAEDRLDEWSNERTAIRDVILAEGWNEEVGAFTQFFGSTSLDASNLMIPLVGFLPADDPRVMATIDMTEKHLTDDRGLVYRYRSDDGLEGEEGAFLLCTFWLAEALATAGHTERARTVFERAVAYVNDVGLLSEEVESVTGELLGNHPQAFSHIGLINAAWAIDQAVSQLD